MNMEEWQREGSFKAVEHYKKILVEKLKAEGISPNPLRRDMITAYLIKFFDDNVHKITFYTSLNPERLSIDVEELYEDVKGEIYSESRKQRTESERIPTYILTVDLNGKIKEAEFIGETPWVKE